MRSKNIVCGFTIALLVAGCQSQQKKSQQALQSARSSVSAAALTGDAWLHGRVPSAFARDAFKSATKQLTKTLATPLPAAAAHAIKQANAAVQQAGTAIKQHDRARVTQSTEQLRSARDVLEQALRKAQQS